MFGLIEIKPGTFRGNLVNEVDINEYIKSYSLKTNTRWCVESSKMSTRFVCRKIFKCHHSSFHKKTPKENNKGKSKNNLYVKDGLPAVISIQNDHNHTVVSEEALSYLRPTKGLNIQFEAYFNSGLGISESIRIHEENIELKHGINSTELANAHINPKYRTVRYWYDEWKKLNLGPHSGIGFNKILEEKMYEYEKNNIIVKFQEDPFAITIITPIMQRAHNLKFAKDIAFVDSTASYDSQSHSVTFMLTACGIGAVPLAVMITKGQSLDDYIAVFKLLKEAVPLAFCSQGYRLQFLTDDSEAERQALQYVWPNSKSLLCRFHICQSVWCGLFEKKNTILILKIQKYYMENFKHNMIFQYEINKAQNN
ncbi:hypothetical protein AGLY_009322 [Aphis glycines]|uniref:Uncharacterized protein n=1 Tax=Aphis glycines TaxID=307491 RepID=A0A6G0TI77_APHGL|nr:hypothetical protein AGLY_009322 [Aphis glycines]